MKPSSRRESKAESFPGLISNADPGDIPFGATVVQDNIQSLVPGKLTVRKGWARATSYCRSDVGTVSRPDLTNIYRYRQALKDKILTVSSAGAICSRGNNTVTEIKTGEYGDTCWSFGRDRCGALLGINGFGRGIYWDGTSASAEKLGLDPPTVAPTATLAGSSGGTIGVRTAGVYSIYYRYAAGPAGYYHYSNLSPVTEVTVAVGDIGKYLSYSLLQVSSQPRVHTIEVWRSLPGDENTLYLVGSIRTNLNGLTFAGHGGGSNLKVTTRQVHGLAVNDIISITGSVADNGTHIVTSIISDYQFVTNQVWSGSGAGSAAIAGSGLVDAYTDTELQDRAIADPNNVMLIVSNGELVANRFVPPPEWKHSMAKFQDRMFYAADAILEATATTTANSNAITINGLSLGANWYWNRVLYVYGEPAAMGSSAWINSSQLRVDPPPVNSAVSQSLVVRPPDCERNVIYYSEPDEPQSVPLTNRVTIQEQAEDEDEIVGIHSFGPYLFILKEHHVYTLSFVRQPRIDAQARLLVHRGAFNKNCWDTFEGVAYVMDSAGCYVLGMNGAMENISEPIQNMWRDGTIDITSTKWFHVKVDSKYSVARFYVRYTGDLGTRCRRALCYNIRTGAWWTESYCMEIAQSVSIDEAGNRFNLGACQNDLVCDLAKNEADMLSAEVRGTVESATAETIADSGTVFTSSMIGAPLAIIDGNGRGQVRTIVEIVTANIVRVDTIGTPIVNFDQGPLSPVPAVGSKFLIGGINFRARFGSYSVLDDDANNRRGVVIEYTPTVRDYSLWLRRFWDYLDSAEVNAISEDDGTGVRSFIGTPEHWISTFKNLSLRNARIGKSRVTFSGKRDENSQARWSLSVEVEGIKGQDAIEINSMALEGNG